MKKWIRLSLVILTAVLALYLFHERAERLYVRRQEERLKRDAAVRNRRKAVRRLLRWKAKREASSAQGV